MTDHPITPPPELVKQWQNEAMKSFRTNGIKAYEQDIATLAARWGSDQELEACCEWLQDPDLNVDTYKLRAARRPKPLSLSEEALKEINLMEGAMYSADLGCDFTATRRALERLQELENNG